MQSGTTDRATNIHRSRMYNIHDCSLGRSLVWCIQCIQSDPRTNAVMYGTHCVCVIYRILLYHKTAQKKTTHLHTKFVIKMELSWRTKNERKGKKTIRRCRWCCCCDMRCRVRVNKNKDRPELVRNTTSEHISFGCCSDLCLMFLVHQLRSAFFPSFFFLWVLCFLAFFQRITATWLDSFLHFVFFPPCNNNVTQPQWFLVGILCVCFFSFQNIAMRTHSTTAKNVISPSCCSLSFHF